MSPKLLSANSISFLFPQEVSVLPHPDYHIKQTPTFHEAAKRKETSAGPKSSSPNLSRNSCFNTKENPSVGKFFEKSTLDSAVSFDRSTMVHLHNIPTHAITRAQNTRYSFKYA